MEATKQKELEDTHKDVGRKFKMLKETELKAQTNTESGKVLFNISRLLYMA